MKNNKHHFQNRLADLYAERLSPSAAYSFRKENVFYDISSAATWWLQSEKDSLHWIEDLPSIASPSPYAWYEYLEPEKRFIEGKWYKGHGLRCAALMMRHELPENLQIETKAKWLQQAWICLQGQNQIFILGGIITDLLDEKGHPFIPSHPNCGKQKEGHEIAGITPKGCSSKDLGMACAEEALKTRTRVVISLELPNHLPSGTFEEKSLASALAITEMFLTICIGISMLHCKNIETPQESFDPAVLTKINQERHALGKNPIIRFKVLTVKPFKKKIQELTGVNEIPSIKKAMHIMRGHFKTFTEQAPLFGKYVGTYWWEQSVRGSLQQGLIKKSYLVEATK